MSTILSFPDRGKWGDPKWRGNCSGHIYKSLFEQFRPRFFIDPMVGSGTSVEVAKEMGIEALGLDLHSGFNVLRKSILEAANGREADMVVSHPPYHSMLIYAGVQYPEMHPDCLSRCGSVDEFNEKLQVALLNQRHATKVDGIYGMIMGDYRKDGSYHCFSAEMIARMPSDELAGVIIKGQHNTMSERKSYGRMRFPFVTHEYIVLWVRKARWRSTLELLSTMAKQAHQRLQGVWKSVVHEAFIRSGKPALPLAELYEVVAANAPEKVAANENWRAKVRQTLQMDPRFQNVDRGYWSLKAA